MGPDRGARKKREAVHMASLSTTFELSGGFHSSAPIQIRVWGLRFDGPDEDIPAALDQWLTPYQRRRLERHFCGIPGCACGSWHRAEIRVIPTPADQ